MYLITFYFWLTFSTKRYSNGYYVVKEILPSKEYIPIDIGYLDESDFITETTDHYENNSIIRYDFSKMSSIVDDYLSLKTYIDNLDPILDKNFDCQNSITLHNGINKSIMDIPEYTLNHTNTSIINIEEIFKFNKIICMFQNDIKLVQSQLEYLVNLMDPKNYSYEIYNDILLNSMTNLMYLPNIFHIDRCHYADDINDNISRIFHFMNFIKEFDFSKLNIETYSNIDGKKELFEIISHYRRNINSSIYKFIDSNIVVLDKIADNINHEMKNKKISKEILISCIVESINIIQDPLDKIVLYKCFYDILTRKQSVYCLIRLLLHIMLYYKEGNIYVDYNEEFFLLDKLSNLLTCCNPQLIIDLKSIFKSNSGKISKLFSDYYLIKSKDLLIENIVIYGMILNLVVDNQTNNYYIILDKVFNMRYNDNKALRFVSNIIMQGVIKILEDNKLL